MAKMKKFFKYLIWLILLYLLVNGLTYLATKDDYRDLTNFNIATESPKIEVTESKSAYTHGYIKGQVTNDTGKHIPKTYLQIDFYNKDGVWLGKETKELESFNLNETIKFDISYTYTDVNKIRLSISDEIIEAPKTKTQKTIEKWWPVAGIITLVYLLP
ncbi:MAG: FxLYD domain-containing protein [Clostridia bacterium]|nr:FxLYD domain-containing protein [Clostridia bacterium]